MKKLLLSAAVLTVLTGGMSAAVAVVTEVPASACAGTSNPSSAVAAKLPQVNYRDRGQHVLALQLALRLDGYTYLDGTGLYATETLRAVKDYQREHHIRASGIVGSKTWQALVGTKSTVGTGGSLHHQAAFTLRPGERNEHKVAQLVNMLQRIHPYTKKAELGSDYTPALQKLVRDFQKRAGIKSSGIVGPKTVTAMNEVISVSAQWGC